MLSHGSEAAGGAHRDLDWRSVCGRAPQIQCPVRGHANYLVQRVGVEPARTRMVLNNSVPNHAGKLSAQDVATRLQRDIAVVLPFTRAAVAACNTGQPVVLTSSKLSGFRRRIVELVDLTVSSESAMTESKL